MVQDAPGDRDRSGFGRPMQDACSVASGAHAAGSGWHWGASKKISKALCMNQIDAHSDTIYQENDINPNTLIILKSVISYSKDSTQFYTHCDNATQLIRAKAIYYEPTLKVNSFDTLNTENYDNMNPVFGFKGVRGRVENDASTHRSRLVLYDANLNGQVVLEGLNNKNIFANHNIFL